MQPPRNPMEARTEAIEELINLLSSKDEGHRLRAAELILDHTIEQPTFGPGFDCSPDEEEAWDD